MAQKPEYAGTVAQAAAEYRLKIMDDFKSPVVFKPAPPQPQAARGSGPDDPDPAGRRNRSDGDPGSERPECKAGGPRTGRSGSGNSPGPVEANKPAGG